MIPPESWRKSTYSGGGDGNDCVEIATTPTHTAVRDTKDPAGGTLTFPAGTFAAFLDGVKGGYSTVTDFARFRG
ncbi:hypothetical protein SZN_12268 [Streptomyces zinciresistens K42]|uniref:DUF397 domain-containing protein n=1 Tax=Streptomyces zinciresistens K42 TaxID=700597 RepID=G2GAD1_9ACTN|nr:DUF397 domain-containing protein [Streptomyces zinciresistens]EGX59505.1 hypothetical protein SZN_12268 [Streptomyces zinciresistens K42]